jgi:hypothetical protein
VPHPVPRPAPGALARLAAVALLALGLVLAAPGAAAAHTGLRGTDPADGATVPGPLPAVTLTFSARVLGGEVTVTGPDGTPAGTGEVVHDGAVLTAPVALTAAGRHTVTWSAVADDGHVLDGSFAFEHAPAALPTAGAPSPRTPPTAAPTTARPPDDEPGDPAADATPTATPSDTATDTAASSADDGTPGWVLPAAGVAALAALLAGGLLLRRRRR